MTKVHPMTIGLSQDVINVAATPFGIAGQGWTETVAAVEAAGFSTREAVLAATWAADTFTPGV